MWLLAIVNDLETTFGVWDNFSRKRIRAVPREVVNLQIGKGIWELPYSSTMDQSIHKGKEMHKGKNSLREVKETSYWWQTSNNTELSSETTLKWSSHEEIKQLRELSSEHKRMRRGAQRYCFKHFKHKSA